MLLCKDVNVKIFCELRSVPRMIKKMECIYIEYFIYTLMNLIVLHPFLAFHPFENFHTHSLPLHGKEQPGQY